MKATPRVHLDGDVTLQLEFDLSSLSGQVFNTIPVISNNTISQTVRVKENETAVLAGVLQRQLSNAISGAPGLATLPELGFFAGDQNAQKQDSELLILVTPRMVRYAPRQDHVIYAGQGSLEGQGAAPAGIPLPPPPPGQPPPQPGQPGQPERSRATHTVQPNNQAECLSRLPRWARRSGSLNNRSQRAATASARRKVRRGGGTRSAASTAATGQQPQQQQPQQAISRSNSRRPAAIGPASGEFAEILSRISGCGFQHEDWLVRAGDDGLGNGNQVTLLIEHAQSGGLPIA